MSHTYRSLQKDSWKLKEKKERESFLFQYYVFAGMNFCYCELWRKLVRKKPIILENFHWESWARMSGGLCSSGSPGTRETEKRKQNQDICLLIKYLLKMYAHFFKVIHCTPCSTCPVTIMRVLTPTSGPALGSYSNELVSSCPEIAASFRAWFCASRGQVYSES